MSAPARTGALGLALAAALTGAAGQGPVYLVPGQGANGEVLIGDRRSPQGGWQEVKPGQGLEYQTNPAGEVIAIRCRAADCVTDQGLRVRMPEAELIRRYGAPRREIKTREGGRYYEYPGAGFEVHQGSVTAIYIIARVPTQQAAPASPVKALERTQVRQRHRVFLGGEFGGRLALYVGDVEENSAFRLLIYVPAETGESAAGGMMPTAIARSEAAKMLFDARIDPALRQVNFAHEQKQYQLTFSVVAGKGTRLDRLEFEIFRR